MDVIVERCAGLDVHKKTVMACVRTTGRGSTAQAVAGVAHVGTFTSLAELRGWLVGEGVTQVAMEATGVVLEAGVACAGGRRRSSCCWSTPQHVKNLPGRKTDVNDAAWLAQLLECGLLRGSFVPPPVIARLRDLTRYRTKLVAGPGREVQRVQKVLEDAGIKLDSVASDVMGVTGRLMIDALSPANATPR